jgi:methylenetetrahydrofolate reductase (NADPH)
MNEFGLCAMAHLTCSGASASEVARVAEDFAIRGVENVLALRGDPPGGGARFTAALGGFSHAAELCRFLRQHFDFGLGAACYPEKHSEAPSWDADLERLREKVEAGAEYLITQLFFEPDLYSEFVARARNAGITVPILPGVLPATDLRALVRMSEKCGAGVPERVRELLAPHEHDPRAMLEVGIEFTRAQCRALLELGAPGLHFYTRNRWPEVSAVLDALDLGGCSRRGSEGARVGPAAWSGEQC